MSDQLWPAKATNAVTWFGLSSVIIFLPVFYSASFDKFQIGILTAIPCVSALIAPPLWGAVADVLQQQRTVHVFCIVTGAVLMFAIQYAVPTSFVLTCAVVFAANIQSTTTRSMLDQAVMALVKRIGGEYGKQRLFGAVGWGLGAFLTGVVVNAYGIHWIFTLHLAVTLPSIGLLQLIPAPTPPATSPSATKSTATLSFADGMRRVVRQPDVLLLLTVVLLLGSMFGVLSSFLGLYLYELSANDSTLVGTAVWVQTLSELPAFYFATALTKRYGIVRILFLSILAYGVRISYYAVVVHPWTVLPFELLHGVTFAFSWAACTQYVYDAAPPGTEGTMMGLLNAMLNGLGRGAGTLLGGYLFQTHGARAMWWATDMGVPLALIALFFFARSLPLTETHHQSSAVMINLREDQPLVVDEMP
ncbi:Aste57867_20073 [Aphanomyces stellatus]|uniref:Aste57867_20073 protein n=1 Tax=Aphanomyces stellatus TaxID=120398 RepID=A0A485LE50_9STRA|nr:hypothetical protein As57867_020007 [Aphanomyces stellatus]VFT96768.1 Aste57867_20073 [Aphanomyces stellatus]